LSEFLNAHSLFHFEIFEFLSEVHGLFDALIDSDQLLVDLVFLQFGRWLDFGGLNSTIELLIELLHLHLVLLLQVFDLDQ
jgi:hypothetical protein